jgi:hypothetical protein
MITIWSARTPVYASGQAIVVAPDNPRESARVVAFLPPESLSQITTQQQLSLQSASSNQRVTVSILAVEPDILSPQVIQQRFGTSIPMSQPAAVVIAQFAAPGTSSAATYAGSVFQAHIQVGSQRLITRLPFIGQLFEEAP